MQNVLWDRIKKLLGPKMTQKTIPLAEWHKHVGPQIPSPGDIRKHPGGTQIVAGVTAGGVSLQIWETDYDLSPLEEELIRLMLKENPLEIPDGRSEVERFSRELGAWISREMASGDGHSVLPRDLGLWDQLKNVRIPLLLVCGHGNDHLPSFSEFHQTLKEFLIDDTLLVPLSGEEWLILVSDQIMAEMEGYHDPSEEDADIRKVLYSFASGLQQMMTEEWGGDFHVAIGEPFCPEESLVHTTAVLKETIKLGRQFHQQMRVHVPWLVHLERLLSGIPESAKVRFIESVAVPPQVFDDPEISTTLEAFFQMDGKIGEASRKLYIHRNTLLYRLDKFKLETGLDVRSFSDAVLVRILMLLYKATKKA